jgi:hypothetical protein
MAGVHSVGAVQWCQFTAGSGCEGPQPSKLPPIIVATTRWPLLAESLADVRSVGAVQCCQFTAGNGCEGPQVLQAPHRSSLPRPDGHLLAESLAGIRSVGAVQLVSIYGRQLLRGTAALQKPVVEAAERQRQRRVVIFE